MFEINTTKLVPVVYTVRWQHWDTWGKLTETHVQDFESVTEARQFIIRELTTAKNIALEKREALDPFDGKPVYHEPKKSQPNPKFGDNLKPHNYAK